MSKHQIDKNCLNSYDVIVAPKFSKITAAIWQLNKKAELHIIDDGISAFHPNNISHLVNYTSKTYRYLFKLFNYNRDFSNYNCYYLNNTEIYKANKNDHIKEIPKYDYNMIKTIKDILHFNQNTEKNKSIYWLSQYADIDIEKSIGNILIKYSNHVLHREHPRHKINLKYNFQIDNSDIWELELLDIPDINKKCFVSVFSTSCVSAKLMYDFEPFLILTYKISKNSNHLNEKELDNSIEVFKKQYTNPEKIMTPKSLEEFDECLKKYIHHQIDY